VLLVSTDPCGSLASIFEREVFEEPVEVKDNLWVIELTREKILKMWREKFGEDLYAVLSSIIPVKKDALDYIESIPGIETEFMLDFILQALLSRKYDFIIWDTAPTASILSLLNTQFIFYQHLTQAQRIYFKVKSFFQKKPLLKLIDSWKRLTADILDMLKEQTEVWLVATPEPMPVTQAIYLEKELEKFGMKVKGIVLNRLLLENECPECRYFQQRLKLQNKWKERLKSQTQKPVVYLQEQETGLSLSLLEKLGEKVIA